jgi:hypothetical protein
MKAEWRAWIGSPVSWPSVPILVTLWGLPGMAAAELSMVFDAAFVAQQHLTICKACRQFTVHCHCYGMLVDSVVLGRQAGICQAGGAGETTASSKETQLSPPSGTPTSRRDCTARAQLVQQCDCSFKLDPTKLDPMDMLT